MVYIKRFGICQTFNHLLCLWFHGRMMMNNFPFSILFLPDKGKSCFNHIPAPVFVNLKVIHSGMQICVLSQWLNFFLFYFPFRIFFEEMLEIFLNSRFAQLEFRRYCWKKSGFFRI